MIALDGSVGHDEVPVAARLVALVAGVLENLSVGAAGGVDHAPALRRAPVESNGSVLAALTFTSQS